jgi:nucleoid-associated protein YgaU
VKANTAKVVESEQVEPIPHVVESGENFWTISRLHYGSGRYYKALWKANSQLVSAPDRLVVGMTIRIPPPEQLDRNLIEPPRANRSPSAAGSTLRRTSQALPRGGRAGTGATRSSEVELALPVADPLVDREPKPSSDPDPAPETRLRPRRVVHKVLPHETLRSIARDTLGDSHRFEEILELNRDVVDDPYNLVPGQVLELPEDAKVGRRARSSSR